MGSKTGTLRRLVGVMALTIGVFALTGQPAFSAATPTLNGEADSQALRIKLTVNGKLVLDQALSIMHADSLRQGAIGQSGGFAALRQGVCGDEAICTKVKDALEGVCGGSEACVKLEDLQNSVVSTRCVRGQACDGTKSIGHINLPLGELEVGDLVVKNKFGEVDVEGATSTTPDWDRTKQTTGRAKVTLDLAALLAATGIEDTSAIDTLYNVVNGTALPQVNKVIDTLKPSVDGLLDTTGLGDYVTFGNIAPLPDIRKVDLLSATITGAKAELAPKLDQEAEALGILAQSSSKLLDLEILGGWVSADAIGLATSAYANGVRGASNAKADVTLADIQIGAGQLEDVLTALLGINIPADKLGALLDLEKAKQSVVDTAPDALKPAAQDLVDVVTLLQTIAGVDVQLGAKKEVVDPKGRFASAEATTLAIVFEPKIPNVEALTRKPVDGSLIPTLDPNKDFTSAGLRLEVSLPSASSVSAATTDVLPFNPPPRTGVGTPLVAGLGLLAAAILVRRVGLAK